MKWKKKVSYQEMARTHLYKVKSNLERKSNDLDKIQLREVKSLIKHLNEKWK